MLTKKKQRSRFNRVLPCKGKGTFLQDISDLYFMCFLSWSHVLSISLRCNFFPLPAVTASSHWCHISVPLQTEL